MRVSLCGFILAIAAAQPLQAAEDPTPHEILDALYMTVALVEFCQIQTDPVVGQKVARAGYTLEKLLNLTPDQSRSNLEQVKLSLLMAQPDCSEDSADIAGLRAIIGAKPQ